MRLLWSLRKRLSQLETHVNGLLAWKNLQTTSLEDEVLRLRNELALEREQNAKLFDLLAKMKPSSCPRTSTGMTRSRDAVLEAQRLEMERVLQEATHG